jgi:hypothetical protein
MILKIYFYQSRIILYLNFEMNWLILGKKQVYFQKKINLDSNLDFFQIFE